MSLNASAEELTALDKFKVYIDKAATVFAVGMSTFHIVTASLGSLPTMQQRSVHLGFVLVLIFCQKATARKSSWLSTIMMLLCVVFSILETFYVLRNYEDMALYSASPEFTDLLFGGFLLAAAIYCTYLRIGAAMPVIASIFIAYALTGNYMPALIAHRGYSLTRIISQSFMSTEGIYSSVLGISATYIFLFILFGSLLEYSGAANFFIDLALALFGKKRGGSAKVATVASCLFGMVSGSATANIMAIGPLTMPMMEQEGYPKRFGGAILSVAGTGGQLMPPIMGAAAFLIAETLGIPYIRVALAAFIPGFLYYATLWFIIDIRSNREKITELPDELIPDWKVVVKNGFYLSFPFLLLVYFMAVLYWSPIKSGFWAIIALIVVSWVKKETRIGPKKLAVAFKRAAYDSLSVAVVCSLAGVITGMLSLTGLGIRFSTLLVVLSGGNMIVLMVLTAVAGIILGMGMGTTSVYIILAVMVAPAMISRGINPLAAHLFVFYFGLLSGITPPVALASYAAAGVAKDQPMPLGFMAWKMGLSGYILPFMFVYNNDLLFMGTLPDVVKCVVTSSIGIFALSCSVEGFFKMPLNIVHRAALFIGALCLIDAGFFTDVIGLALVLGVLVPNHLADRRQAA
ncbi:MAG: TRAP transporter fused permease subunit [Synergistaceae bacterium]|jgi:TRAP transporter 4TM/12TM fusion protein|nr:TRAP transporter fused permease subunit [Synergistaceae bacterium]